jgi:hypothetical protein
MCKARMRPLDLNFGNCATDVFSECDTDEVRKVFLKVLLCTCLDYHTLIECLIFILFILLGNSRWRLVLPPFGPPG